MKAYTKPWAIHSAITRRGKIDPTPRYQRPPVWSLPQKQLLMDTILREYDIPKLYLRSIDRKAYEWEVVDGQQRLRSIWEFYTGDYALREDMDPIRVRNGKEYKCANKKFDELDDDLKDIFNGYQLDIVIFEEATDDEIEDMFVRYQNGTTLKAAEKRNAISGNMRDCSSAFFP